MSVVTNLESRYTENLPWPFREEQQDFQYSVNVEPARILKKTQAGKWGAEIVDLGGEEYLHIMKERRRILEEDPSRVQILPGMMPACWDLLMYYLRDLSIAHPTSMHLKEDGDVVHWRNDLLGTDQTFRIGDEDSLPFDPLTFLGREIPDDLLLVKERGGQLYFDAGLVTFAAAWSVTFDAGMSFREIHTPVPRLNGEGITSRAEQFLMRLPQDKVYRRVNWTLSASGSRKLDISLEKLPEWGQDIPQLLATGDLGNLQLRIELEHFIRLPMSGAITFSIRTFMASLKEIKNIPIWRDQLAKILMSTPEDIATYKGFIEYREAAAAWLLEK
ncbi:hypothetical protein HD598_000661 [Neomicrococcus aestuarii]|uniref:DUF3445 domain-containing protein n=1 Tax=Neomicrococcus aestuarii TaxID=556325 RepID=A0A7W8TS98_9MICC|nr:DUF3445 domain-containing protein [Neomicrococcus aestuarii]MBB5511974.1 hypothetical protein [Neomicrococcus aestuarii]